MSMFTKLYQHPIDQRPTTIGELTAHAFWTLARHVEKLPDQLNRASTVIRRTLARLTPGHKARVRAAQAHTERVETVEALETITAALVAAYGSMAVAALAQSILHGKDPHRGRAAGMLFDAIAATALKSSEPVTQHEWW